MKKTKRYETGGEIDALEAANASETAQEIADKDRGESILVRMRDEAAKPKMAKPKAKDKTVPKPAAVAETKPAAKPAANTDVTKMSLSERAAATRERARSGSGATDTRSVNQRIRGLFGMNKDSETKKMASGGMTSSASKRGDGIAIKGKTRGKMC
jgi:hypothetical protein